MSRVILALQFVTLCFVLSIDAKMNITQLTSTPCANLPPGFNKLTLGVDITEVDFQPFDISAHDGFRGRVIEFTCNQGRFWRSPYDNITYQVPDQVWTVTSRPGSLSEVDTNVYWRKEEIIQERSSRAHVEVDAFGSYFSASSSYRMMSSEIELDNKVVTEAETLVSSIDAYLAPPSVLGLPYEVLNIVESLPENFEDNPEAYLKFIRHFGTHYISIGEFGGYIKYIFSTNSSYYDSHKTSDLAREARGCLFGFLKGAGGYSLNYTSSSSQFNEHTNKYLLYHGGETDFLDLNQLRDWKKSVHRNPWLYSGKLVKISELIVDKKRSESMKRAYKEMSLRNLYLIKNHQKVIMHKLRQSFTKYSSVNSSLLVSLLEEANQLFNIDAPNITAVAQFGKKVDFHVIPGQWWKETQMCLRTRRTNESSTLCNDGHHCSRASQYTPSYPDYTRFPDYTGYPDYTNPDYTGCYMSWGVFAPTYAEEWFRKIQICFKSTPYGPSFTCNGTNTTEEHCVPLNAYTTEFLDFSSSTNTRCYMQWMLKTEGEVPFWFQNVQLCLSHTHDNFNCWRYDSERPACAKHNQWTNSVRDESGSYSTTCNYQWGLIETLQQSVI